MKRKFNDIILSTLDYIILRNPSQGACSDFRISPDRFLSIYNACCWHLNNKGYVVGKFNNRRYYLHNFLMPFPPEGCVVHHKNEDILDNTDDNLEYATRRYNCLISKKREDNSSSLYFGVCFDNTTNKYRAYTKLEGKHLSLGFYQSEILAAIMFDKWLLDRGLPYNETNLGNNKYTLENLLSYGYALTEENKIGELV